MSEAEQLGPQEQLGPPEYPGGVPSTWQVTVRRARLDGGRWLVYDDFVPSSDVAEVILELRSATA